nr:penicillin-binding transpeptidase domain-containing protein [Deinobacterium chartae]
MTAYAARLYDLQIRRYDQYRGQSQQNYLRDEVIRSLRGEIRTRDGVLLATNRIAVDLIYRGGPVEAWDRIRYLAKIKDPQLPELPAGQKEMVLAANVPAGAIPALEELSVLQPALELRQRVERYYPQGKLAGNLIGYTSEANEQEVESGAYILGDAVGRSGLEAGFQQQLHGVNGLKLVEVDSQGRRISERIEREGKKGEDIVLTLDSRLQRAAEKALTEGLSDINKGRAHYGLPPEKVVKGAIIALDPRNNEVLAMATAPSIDPNWFSRSPRPKELVEALTGPDAGLLNRAVQPYAPGSVFKPTTTNAYFERFGNKTFTCTPGIVFGGYYKKNWARYNMGPMDGRGAIAQSCNTWYYQASIDAGTLTFSDIIADRAREFGFGSPTGLELIGEKGGLVQSARDFKARNQPWYPGETLNYSIGQGALLVTPAQIALSLSTIVNEGKKRPLTLLKSVAGRPVPRKPAVQVPGQTKYWKLTKEGMEWTVSRGTSKHVLGPDLFPVRTAGKTGTAQTGRRAGYEHSWYEGYGPVGNPNLLVVAFFEYGGEGSGVALPAVKKVMAAYWDIPLDKDGHVIREEHATR